MKDDLLTENQYWKLRKGFERYAANVAQLNINRTIHPNYYDEDETETAWQSWVACFKYLTPLIDGYVLMHKG